MPPRGKKPGTPARNKAAAKDTIGKAKKDKSGKRTNEHQEEDPDKKEREAKVVDLEWDCPWCDKGCTATVMRRTITPMTPAETKLVAIVRRDNQGKLDLGGAEDSDTVRVKAEKVK